MYLQKIHPEQFQRTSRAITSRKRSHSLPLTIEAASVRLSLYGQRSYATHGFQLHRMAKYEVGSPRLTPALLLCQGLGPAMLRRLGWELVFHSTHVHTPLRQHIHFVFVPPSYFHMMPWCAIAIAAPCAEPSYSSFIRYRNSVLTMCRHHTFIWCHGTLQQLLYLAPNQLCKKVSFDSKEMCWKSVRYKYKPPVIRVPVTHI